MIAYSTVYNFANAIQLNAGEVVSESLYNSDSVDISFFGLSKGENISYEKAHFDRLYIPIEGVLQMSIKCEGIKTQLIKPYELFIVEKNISREISSETDYKLLMITIKRKETMLKNIEKQVLLNLDEQIEYKENKIASKTLANDEKLSMTLLAFEGKQELSTHSAPGDALVIALDGEARINIDGEDFTVKKGESIIMPASIPHGVYVDGKYKMLLIVSK